MDPSRQAGNEAGNGEDILPVIRTTGRPLPEQTADVLGALERWLEEGFDGSTKTRAH